MSRVKLLSDQVANQIAAGEVVERPMSVVKELVENALDAQADRITIEISSGGRTLIRVSDNGIGMSREDALMSLESHATSKISELEDLNQIHTMGFRGEALPSIASVSRMILMTREHSDEEGNGTEIVINGGKIISVKPAGIPPGTSIEVRNLFFNVPARRKFMRSIETERAHIQHYITLVAMVYPQISLSFIQDGKLVFQFPAGRENKANDLKLLRDRIRLVYGTGDDLLEVDNSIQYDSTPNEDLIAGIPSRMISLKLWGFIGVPGVSRTSKDRVQFFVNKRPVENKTLNFALMDAYQNALMKGRYPICCLFMEIEPAEVDVNIHPAKREVRFHKEASVRRIVAKILREALERYSQISISDLPEGECPVISENKEMKSSNPMMDNPLPKESNYPVYPRKQLKQTVVKKGERQFIPRREEVSSIHEAKLQLKTQNEKMLFQSESNFQEGFLNLDSSSKHRREELTSVERSDLVAPAVPLLQVPLRYLGVLNRLYMLFESDRGLVLVDQHAAHERVLFERLMRQTQQGTAESQRLLLSETIEVGVRDAILIKEYISDLNRLGIGIHEFGEHTFLVDALPPFVKNVSARQFALDLLEALRNSTRELSQADLAVEMIATHACRLAVKAHDQLNQEELDHLMSDLKQCSMPYTCPHGRPTIIEINERELAKKFRRIV